MGYLRKVTDVFFLQFPGYDSSTQVEKRLKRRHETDGGDKARSMLVRGGPELVRVTSSLINLRADLYQNQRGSSDRREAG